MNEVEADEGARVDRDAELERLRRLAFGRTTTDAEVAAAAAAGRSLAALEAEDALAREAEERARAERDAGERAAAADAAEPAHPLTTDGAADDNFDGEPAASRWRAWLLPVGAGILVGAFAVGGAMWVARPWPSEPGAAVSENLDGGINYFLGGEPDGEPGDGAVDDSLPPGDPEAAGRWFEPLQTPADLVGVPELRPEFDRGSVRLVHSSSEARVWVTRKTDGSLCLETTETDTQATNGTCASPEDFAAESLRVTSGALTATWSGSQLSVVLGPR